MNKQQFLTLLSKELKKTPDSEQKRIMDYYSEMIDDHIENGMTEDEAISAIGSMSEIMHSLSVESVPTESSASAASPTFYYEPIHSILVDCERVNLKVHSGNVKNNATVSISYNGDEFIPLTSILEDGCLTIRLTEPEPGSIAARLFRRAIAGFGFQNVTCTITLSSPDLDRAILNSFSGNISVQTLNLSGELVAHTRSGGITADNLSCSSCLLKSGSGSIEAQAFRASGSFTAESCSGSIKANAISSEENSSLIAMSGSVKSNALCIGGDLTIKSTSGSIKAASAAVNRTCMIDAGSGSINVESLRADSFRAKVHSGSIRVDGVHINNEVSMISSSGSIRFEHLEANHIQLSAGSGSISGTLIGNENTYDIRANTSVGNVSIPDSRGSRIVKASATCGRIHISVEPE